MVSVLVVSDLWPPFPGGAERLAFNLARDLMRRGEDVRVLCGYYDAQRFDGPPFRVIEVPEDEEGEKVLRNAIIDAEPDVIVAHHYWALNFGEVIRHAAHVPLVQLVLNGRRLSWAAMAVYISEYVRTTLGDSQAQDMTILPPAFDDVHAESHGDAIGFIKPLHHKGVGLVYDIARAMPERQFVILRGEWQDIETIVRLPNVEFMEPVVDMRDFYSRVRLVLMPSLSEDAGTVAQECAVNDIPCISSWEGGLPESNRGGVHVPSHDPSVWMARIAELDHPDVYAHVVAQQHRLTPTDQTALLDEFAARVRALQ